MAKDDSTLFSLDRLTRQSAEAARAAPTEDSGLIDLDKLTQVASASSESPAHLEPARFAPPPPLLVRPEESTLTGMSAARVEAPRSRRWLLGYAALVAVLGVALGVLLDDALDEPRAATSAPITTVVLLPVPAVATTEPRPVDRSEPASSSSASAGAEAKAPPVAPRARAKPPRVSRSPAAPAKPTKPANADSNAPTKSDPCSRCNGDLACAMRCSVRSK